MLRIVLVEDSPGDLHWFRLMIAETRVPHDLIVFDTGMAAIRHFRTAPTPDLIISAWKLPILTFEEFIRDLRSIRTYESTPVAVLSGAGDLIRDRAEELGAICCLQKPIDADQLRMIFAWVERAASA